MDYMNDYLLLASILSVRTTVRTLAPVLGLACALQ